MLGSYGWTSTIPRSSTFCGRCREGPPQDDHEEDECEAPADLQGHELDVQRFDRPSWKFFRIYQ
jgi:hypothetical protein